jgi:hypothetical protein
MLVPDGQTGDVAIIGRYDGRRVIDNGENLLKDISADTFTVDRGVGEDDEVLNLFIVFLLHLLIRGVDRVVSVWDRSRGDRSGTQTSPRARQ